MPPALPEATETDFLARNTLPDSFTACPAIAGGEIILRGHRILCCIAAQ